MMDNEEESEKLMAMIEGKYPAERCSLAEYRDVLHELACALRERVSQLDEEIGDG